MRYDRNPVHRKIITPWYDSRLPFAIAIIFALLVFLFGMTGVFVALQHPEHQDKIWVPGLLVLLSGATLVSMSIRLARRLKRRFSRNGLL
jgi:hypothetical protein